MSAASSARLRGTNAIAHLAPAASLETVEVGVDTVGLRVPTGS